MKRKLICLIMISALLLTFSVEYTTASSLTLLGCTDEDPLCDLAFGQLGIIRLNNILLLGGTGLRFTGTAQEIITATSDTILINGSITNPTNATVTDTLTTSNKYNFFGEGVLRSWFDHNLDTTAIPQPGFVPASVGGEELTLTSHATSFTGADAIAQWGPCAAGVVLPTPVSDFDSKNGWYMGPGTLSGTAVYTLGPSETFASDETVFAAVPEPATILLFGLGLLGLAVPMRKIK